jgi:hypothetical protein
MTRPRSLQEARAAKERTKELFRRVAPDAAVGIGITKLDGGYGVRVNLRQELSPDLELPGDVDGVPVRFEVTGPARKL